MTAPDPPVPSSPPHPAARTPTTVSVAAARMPRLVILISTFLLSAPRTPLPGGGRFSGEGTSRLMPRIAELKTAAAQGLRIPHPHRLVAGLLGAATALALAPVAASHVTASPSFVSVGTPAIVVFHTPNERPPHATTSLRLQAPAGVDLAVSDPPQGWQLSVSEGVATWTGGRIEKSSVVAFPLQVTANTETGLQTFDAVQGYDDGESVAWQTTLTVLPATGDEAPSQRVDRAVVAGAVGLGVIAVSLLALWRIRRRPLQEG